MKNNQNIVIVLLLISAVVLTAFLVGGALADSPTRSAGLTVVRPPTIYSMVTGSWDSSIDIVYVLDVDAERLNAYVVNTKTESLDLQDSVSLPQAFRSRR